MRFLVYSFISFLIISCFACSNSDIQVQPPQQEANIELIVLGTIQDAGSPQIGCQKKCCKHLWITPDPTRMVVSLGIIDRLSNSLYMIEATPDIARQLEYLDTQSDLDDPKLNGILITHAHIGHYTGLMHLGREALGAKNVPVYTMPRMREYLEENGPWSQLVDNQNIELTTLSKDSTIHLGQSIAITPIRVPHRDEFSETVGYRIKGPNRSILFIPDIDKWSQWNQNIVDEIQDTDVAYLDATFYSGVELNNRDMSEIPHPSIEESMALFSSLDEHNRAKVNFIHFNHTNPVLKRDSKETKIVEKQGYKIAQLGDRIEL